MTVLRDPIADLLTRIRNAKDAKHKFVDVDLSKMKVNILKILHEQQFIESFLVSEEKRKIRVFLRYSFGRKPVITTIKRASRPSLRNYVGYKKIPKIMGGLGVAIVSTPKGILDGETARGQKLGGELLCYIW